MKEKRRILNKKRCPASAIVLTAAGAALGLAAGSGTSMTTDAYHKQKTTTACFKGISAFVNDDLMHRPSVTPGTFMQSHCASEVNSVFQSNPVDVGLEKAKGAAQLSRDTAISAYNTVVDHDVATGAIAGTVVALVIAGGVAMKNHVERSRMEIMHGQAS